MGKIKKNKITVDIVEFDDTFLIEGFKYVLTRTNDNLKKTGNKVSFVEFDENGVGKKLHEDIKLNTSLVLDPGFSYTWLTTLITEIVEVTDKKIKFKTQNSEYILDMVN